MKPTSGLILRNTQLRADSTPIVSLKRHYKKAEQSALLYLFFTTQTSAFLLDISQAYSVHTPRFPYILS